MYTHMSNNMYIIGRQGHREREREREKTAVYKPERETSAELNHAGTEICSLHNGRNKFVLFKPPNLWYFVMQAQADKYTHHPDTAGLIKW